MTAPLIFFRSIEAFIGHYGHETGPLQEEARPSRQAGDYVYDIRRPMSLGVRQNSATENPPVFQIVNGRVDLVQGVSMRDEVV
jgi:hypothetical protein